MGDLSTHVDEARVSLVTIEYGRLRGRHITGQRLWGWKRSLSHCLLAPTSHLLADSQLDPVSHVLIEYLSLLNVIA